MPAASGAYRQEDSMHEHLTIDQIVEYFQGEIARHSLQGHATELKQIQRAVAYLARAAHDMGDELNHERFDILQRAANQRPGSSQA
jgi:hypothetical protein